MKLRELLESGPRRKLFHYTNPYSLLQILLDGKIKSNKYDAGPTGIATVRPSMSDKQSLKLLSSNIHGVKIIIQLDVLKDKVRGVKSEPIAEHPISSKDNIIRALMTRALLSKQEANRYANKILKFDIKKIGKKELRSWLLKEFNKPSLAPAADAMWDHIRNFQSLSKRREGEERIKIKEIPLSKDYIQIELNDDFNTFLSAKNFGPGVKDIFDKKTKWKEMLKKYNNLFIKNKAFNDFKRKLI